MSNVETLIIISKEAIKPSSPTPRHLKTYNLSFSDHFCPPIYIPIIFFYPFYGGHQENAAQILKKSLSQTLTRFYPFSGRLVSSKNGSYVDCNDEGVDFLEARVNTPLSQFAHLHYQSQDHLFPTGAIWGHPKNCLVKVQLTHFDCGGIALAVCLSHKIGDVCTLYKFIKHWAAVNHNDMNLSNNSRALVPIEPQPPQLISTRISVCPEVTFYNKNNCVSKKFIFPNSKIEQLKAEAGTKNPTRVEVINSLLYRCAVRAAKANRRSFYKTFILTQTVNMRKRLANPLQDNTVGNFSWCIQIPTIGISDTKLSLKSLTTRIQKAKSRLSGMTVSQMKFNLKLGVMANKCVPRTLYEFFTCTSLCGYQVYQVDFGWGNPVRVSFPAPDKFFILMDTPSMDGIEAVVCLEEEDMAKFEADEQLLAFAFAA